MSRRRASVFSTQLVSRGGRVHAFKEPVIELRLVGGPSPKQKAQFRLSRVTVGSSALASFRIPADKTVSAVHCELCASDWGLKVRDLGSRNGVFLEGRRVQEAWLEDGDVLLLGQSKLKLIATGGFEERPLSEATHFHGLRGSSWVMRQLYAQLEKAAASDAPVLLRGPTGSGKELAAEALVAAGPRAEKPLVVVDCAALAATLTERELFGHVAGAFTGATTTSAGAIERADGGTLFLDEVGELPLEIQPKLLGVLERKTVQRLGAGQSTSVDVRIISATHRPLDQMVNQGTFRADLYYRLSAIPVFLPPLNSRKEDIPELALQFLKELGREATLSPEQLERLRTGDYPGNVRELKAMVLRQALDLGDTAALPTAVNASSVVQWDFDAPYRLQKERIVGALEKAYLIELLRVCEGNVAEAARRSGMNRVHLYQLFERHRMSRTSGRRSR